MKFREKKLPTGRIICAGKNASNNEELINSAKEEDVLLHTKKPGSPFVNIGTKPSRKEIKEGGIFCASKSQGWRDNKGDIILHIFKKKNIYKKRGMKLGTFGVRKYKEIIIKKTEIEKKNEAN